MNVPPSSSKGLPTLVRDLQGGPGDDGFVLILHRGRGRMILTLNAYPQGPEN